MQCKCGRRLHSTRPLTSVVVIVALSAAAVSPAAIAVTGVMAQISMTPKGSSVVAQRGMCPAAVGMAGPLAAADEVLVPQDGQGGTYTNLLSLFSTHPATVVAVSDAATSPTLSCCTHLSTHQ